MNVVPTGGLTVQYRSNLELFLLLCAGGRKLGAANGAVVFNGLAVSGGERLMDRAVAVGVFKGGIGKVRAVL